MSSLKSILWLVLIVTSDCNLRCEYCYVNGGSKKDQMLPITAKNLILALIREYSQKKELVLTFFGGEPTLNMNMVRQTINFCKTLPQKASFRMVTNGMCSKKTWEYLLDNLYTLSLSMDGSPRINDLTRGSSSGLEDKIRRLVKSGINFQIRSTLTLQNTRFFPESVKWWADLGVKMIHFEEVNVFGRAKKNHIKAAGLSTLIKSLGDVIKIAGDYGIELIHSAWMNLDDPKPYFCDSCKGFQHMLFPDGSIGGCFSAQQNLLFRKNFLVGKLEPFDQKIQWFEQKNILQAISTDTMILCKDCEVKTICGGGCFAKHLASSGSIMTPDAQYCKRKKELIKLGKECMKISGRR
jgi:uncharacterized protein